jgi:undecaprenol kinase/diacylglycerol kinase (ATP)
MFVITCGTTVLVLEALNTALEYMCDLITKDVHPGIRIIKDVAAAAVLLAATGSVLIGLIIFLPKLISLLS